MYPGECYKQFMDFKEEYAEAYLRANGWVATVVEIDKGVFMIKTLREHESGNKYRQTDIIFMAQVLRTRVAAEISKTPRAGDYIAV